MSAFIIARCTARPAEATRRLSHARDAGALWSARTAVQTSWSDNSIGVGNATATRLVVVPTKLVCPRQSMHPSSSNRATQPFKSLLKGAAVIQL